MPHVHIRDFKKTLSVLERVKHFPFSRPANVEELTEVRVDPIKLLAEWKKSTNTKNHCDLGLEETHGVAHDELSAHINENDAVIITHGEPSRLVAALQKAAENHGNADKEITIAVPPEQAETFKTRFASDAHSNANLRTRLWQAGIR